MSIMELAAFSEDLNPINKVLGTLIRQRYMYNMAMYIYNGKQCLTVKESIEAIIEA